MRKTYRTAAAVLAAVMMTGSLLGCSSGTKGGSQSAPAGTQAAGETAGAQKQEAPASDGSVNMEKPPEGMALKEDIVIGMQAKHTTIDQMEASNTQHNYMWRMIQDTPVHFNNKTSELEPQLATEWSTEDGGKTYVFKLRDGVKFHNGETMKASDWIFTFKRMEGTTSCNATFKAIESIEAVDDLTVKMVLAKPNVDWPYMMSLPVASIMSEKAVTEDPEKGPGVGTGPWKIDSYEFGNFTKLVAFGDSWRGAPNAKSFTFRYIPEDSARLIALENGEIDICQDPANIELGRIQDNPNLELVTYKSAGLTYMAFNTQKEPASNEDLRKAVAYGIDIDTILAVAAEGRGQKATSFWGWNEYGYYDCGGYQRDVEKAKEYLAKAYPNGGATLDISVAANRKTIAELMQGQLKEIGLTINIVELDSAGISTTTTNGEHQSCLYGMGFNVFGDDARRILEPGSAVNKAHYKSDLVVELLDKAVGEMDDAKRKDYYKQIQEDVYEHVPYIPLYFPEYFIGVKKGSGGIDLYPTSHHDFSNIFVPAN